jgi:hypothetical protein
LCVRVDILLLTCKKHLHLRIISLKEEVLVHNINLTPLVPNQVSE